MNLYRGCTHGCIYCDSRSSCYQMSHDFEDIAVKGNAPMLLEEALRKKRRLCMIGLHTYSQSPRRAYDITLTGNWVERGGFRFEEFILTPRREDADHGRTE